MEDPTMHLEVRHNFLADVPTDPLCAMGIPLKDDSVHRSFWHAGCMAVDQPTLASSVKVRPLDADVRTCLVHHWMDREEVQFCRRQEAELLHTCVAEPDRGLEGSYTHLVHLLALNPIAPRPNDEDRVPLRADFPSFGSVTTHVLAIVAIAADIVIRKRRTDH
eukprot:CAMPEP_0180577470 /NCGR_PEP_ID=MMETSP1037_2-20121125/11952_1 /TAXON_ID=632150 /ORGANISM="Azadinium spinosum, Strain 3D9" /LENGTH=162 /DNA_ID=CAMNT_0022595221 /DNA_START=703 /DNA_END=1191 /DNA_ORIENTATION=+